MNDMNDKSFSTTAVAAGQLRAIIERIEHLEEEKKAVAEQIKEVYAEAKGSGFDAKTLRKVVSLRKRSTEERQEEEALLDLYLSALGMLPDLTQRCRHPAPPTRRGSRRPRLFSGMRIRTPHGPICLPSPSIGRPGTAKSGRHTQELPPRSRRRAREHSPGFA